MWRLDDGSNLLRLFTYTSMTVVFWAKFGLMNLCPNCKAEVEKPAVICDDCHQWCCSEECYYAHDCGEDAREDTDEGGEA
jgi:hypothetical protein